MGAIAQKLKSRRGASIILALMFFLVCAVIGGAVLASSVSNAGRLSHQAEEQQAYLTVSSAAKLVRDELSGISFSAVDTDHPDLLNSFDLVSDANSLSDVVSEMVKDIYDGVQTMTLYHDFSVSSDDPALEDVTALLTMSDSGSGKYSITVVLSLDGSGQYTMTVAVPVTVSESTVSGVITETNEVSGEETEIPFTTTSISIVFGEGTITKGGAS